MSSKTIDQARRVQGTVTLPGDKSISHRAAMLAAVAEGRSRLFNYSPAEDCQRTLACLEALGVAIERTGAQIGIVGQGPNGWRAPQTTLDAGNSGTTIRLLAGLLAGQHFDSWITGDQSLQRRPMQRIIEPLTQMGARITARDGRFAPLHIHGGALQPITYHLPMASAQVKSCILLAGLFAAGTTTVVEPAPTRDHTERMLNHFGVPVVASNHTISVSGPARLRACEYRIPGDISSAAFLIAAALLLPDSMLRLKDVGVNPTRTGFIDLLRRCGASIALDNVRLWQDEPVADLVVQSSRLRPGSPRPIAGNLVAALIDEIPILAVIATQMEGGLTIREAGELRVKESDRLGALTDNLRRMGAVVEEFDDGLHIPGPQRLHGAQIDAYGDHRIAMAFAIAGLVASGRTQIDASEVAAVSFPDFFSVLEQIVQR